MATITGTKLALCIDKNSESWVSLQGTDFAVDGTDVTIQYPAVGVPTYKWTGKIKKKGKSNKVGQAKVKQDKDVMEKDKNDTTGEVSITVGTTTKKTDADMYVE